MLLTVNTESSARYHGKDQVVYIADFQIQADFPTLGGPVEILQASDLIEIKFNTTSPVRSGGTNPERRSDVITGKASVVFNGGMRLEFEILPQQMQGGMIYVHNIAEEFLKVRETMAR